MHTGRPLVVDLHPVDPEVVAGAVGILGVDQRQCEKGAAVLRPRGDHRQFLEIHRRGTYLAHGSRRLRPDTHLETGRHQIARRPDFCQAGWKAGSGELHSAADQSFRPPPKGHLRATLGAEEVGHKREVAALDRGEEKGRTTRSNHPPVDLRNLQPGVHGRLDNLQITVTIELLDEAS